MDNNRISISTIGAAPTVEPIYLQAGEATIEIVPQISYEKMVDMVQFVIDYAVTDQPILSGLIQNIITDFAIIRFYTNLEVAIERPGATLEEIYREYSILQTYDIIGQVKARVDTKQLSFFYDAVQKTLSGIFSYRNSARGIIDAISATAGKDSEAIQSALDMLKGENGEKLAKLIQFSEGTHPEG